MGLWSQVMRWLGSEEPAGVSTSECAPGGGVAVLEPPPAGGASGVEQEPGEPELPWWQPQGARVATAPVATKPERIDQPGTVEHEVMRRLEVALSDPELELPHLPHIPQQVLALLRQDKAGMGEIAELISQDQVLAAALLRRANSVACRGTEKVLTLQAAVTRLGMRGIRSMVVSESLKHLTVSLSGGRTRGALLWRESLASGHVMAAFAECFQLLLHEPFLVGLLHDIGKVVVLRACSDAERATGQGVSSDAFEYLCQEYHEMMGEMLAEYWQLPEEISRVIRSHHAPLEGRGEQLEIRAAIQLTDATVALLGYGPSIPYDLLSTPAALRLGAAQNEAIMDVLDGLPETIHSAMGEAMDGVLPA